MAHGQPGSATSVRGAGSTVREAVQSLLDAVVVTVADLPDRVGDQAAVVSASAAALDLLIPELASAMLAARDDLEIELASATLDGLIGTDDGWRAWGTVSGSMRRSQHVRRHWVPGPAFMKRATDRLLVVTLSLAEESGSG